MIYHDMTPVTCKRCGSNDSTKCGRIRDKQCFRCKSCGYTFTLGDKRTTEHLDLKKAMLLILHVIAGATVTELGRLFNMCPSQVSRWVTKSGFSYPDQNMYGILDQVNFNKLDNAISLSKKYFDQHRPLIMGQGELIPGYYVMVILQTPDNNKIKPQENPFHECRTLPYIHR